VSGPTFILPTPGVGYVGTPATDAESQDARFFGKDIWFSVDAPGAADGDANWLVDASGDWTAVTGLEALRQSLLRRIITNPGEWRTKPDYGAGARLYVKAKNTAGMREELAGRIKSQLLADPRVESIDLVVVTPLDDGSPGIKVSVSITPVGRLRQMGTLNLSIKVT
jgi:phage baseplate assembly protein W